MGSLIPIACLSCCLALPALADPPPAETEETKAASPEIPEGTAPAIHPLAPVVEAIRGALGDLRPLAVIRPEAIGTDRNIDDLEEWMVAELSKMENPGVLPPEKVIECAGVEFAITPAGIGSVAAKCQAQAALYVRVVISSEGAEVYALLTSHGAEVLLDRAFGLPGLLAAVPPTQPRADAGPRDPASAAPSAADPVSPIPPEPEPMTVAPEPAPDLVAEVPDPAGQPDGLSVAEDAFRRRQLILTPGPRADSFQVMQERRPVGELELARLSGREELIQRLEDRIASVRLRRDLGMGLTLAGSIAAGLATPAFKGDNEGSDIIGTTLTVVGLASAASGAVLWLLYSDEANRIGGPYPVEHLLSREEADELVRAHNDALSRELGVGGGPPEEKEVSLHWHLVPRLDGGASGGLTVAF